MSRWELVLHRRLANGSTGTITMWAPPSCSTEDEAFQWAFEKYGTYSWWDRIYGREANLV